MKFDIIFKKKNSIFIIIIWPYLYLFPITFGFINVGNDFDLIYFSYKRYIAEMLSVGVLPLWSPVESTGISLIFNPFAQYFYIPGWINYLIHFFTKNLTLNHYVLYTISAFSIFSLGIFYWLKSLKIDHYTAFLSALIVATSLKLTELIRFPNAAHAAAWMPWILYGINILYYEKIRKGLIIIFFCNLFILTAGYPYFIIYSIFLFVPYIIFAPLVINDHSKYISNKNVYFYLYNFLIFLSSYLVALPWLLKVKEFLNSLVDRTENNWEFATEHSFYWKDTIGSWIFPSASSTEGWYYFGILTTLTIVFGAIIFFYNKKSFILIEKKLFIYSFLFILFITYFSWGKFSYLFEWSWHNIPLIGSLRTWPRINIILVPFVILLFSISFIKIQNYISQNKLKKFNKSVLFFLFAFVIIVTLQSIFNIYEFQNKEYWDFWQKKRFDAAIKNLPTIFGNYLKLYDGKIYIIFNFISFFFLLAIFLKKISLKKNNLFIALLLIISSELFVLSNLQWGLDKWKTEVNKVENPLELLRQGLFSPRIIDSVKGNEYFRDSRFFNVNYPDNYGYNSHAKNFTKYFQRYEGKQKAGITSETIDDVKLFFGSTEQSKLIFFSKKIDHEDITSFIKDSNRFEIESNFNLELLIDTYNGNELEMNINTEKDGWLSYIDNWDKDWVVFINNEKKQISKLFGSYKSIKIKKGFSKVNFQYKPW